MNDIVQISSVTKTYKGGITAVDDLSLTVRDGEFVTLLGPSGCGKTTTLRMIAGFELPNSGTIKIDGEDVTDLPPYERKVNTVFQDYALFPHMNINENVGYGLWVGGMPKNEIKSAVHDALNTVGLLDKADARPANLSGGQKQRVALARALVRKPKVLLLDEPLSALDAKLREAMQVELKHLHQQSGITFVFVTHDQKEALVMSDRIVVMHDGKIIQAGTPSDLYDHPASPYVADFIGSSNKLYGTVIKSDSGLLSVQCGSHILRGHCGSQRINTGDKVVVTVRPEKVVLLSDKSGMNAQENHIPLTGTVREVLFHGSSCRIKADIGDAQLFDVDVQLQSSLDSTGILNPGAPISLAVNVDSVSVFPIAEDTP